jgi:hypothetical protein
MDRPSVLTMTYSIQQTDHETKPRDRCSAKVPANGEIFDLGTSRGDLGRP